jgi:hypothetical protein
MSPDRRRGLVRLAILLASILALVVVGLSTLRGSSGGGGSSPSSLAQSQSPAPARLTATVSRLRLPVALHGETVAPAANGLLVIGGAGSSGASTDRVYRLDPAAGRVTPDGSLSQPLHDAAAATFNNHTLVFGGGDTTTVDLVQTLTPGGVATSVGHLPSPLSDLSAIPVGGAAYVVGGFDGQRPSASVFQTTDGRAFTRVARLPTPVRYAAAATFGDKIYTFGGELADGSDTNAIQEYDIATEHSVVAGHLVAPISHASAVTIDGTIYLLGGRVHGAATDRILRFDPTRNVGVPAGHLPQPVFDGAATTYRGRAFLLGGLGSAASSLDSVIELR